METERLSDEEWLDNLHQRVTAPVMRCTETHNPGVWPYVTRCILAEGHGDKHTDRHSNVWGDE